MLEPSCKAESSRGEGFPAGSCSSSREDWKGQCRMCLWGNEEVYFTEAHSRDFKCLLLVQILRKTLLQGHMRLCVLQAAAAAAERRARDDAGCACGAKGGTSFTEAEVIELESQLSSAASCQQKVTRESDAQQSGNAEHQSAIGSRAHAQNGTGSEAIPQQQSVQVGLQSGFADRHVHQQRGGTVEQKQSEHQQEDLIDLTADSDHEPEVSD